MPSRRALLQSLAAVGVVGSLTSEAVASERRTRAPDAPPWALLAPLGPGHAVGLGWSIDDLEPIRRGAAVLTLLGPGGRTARVHVCRRAGFPEGIAWSDELDLVLMNGGAGAQPTDESLGRVLKRLADAMGGPAPAGLLSHRERVAAYSGEHEALT